MMPAMGMMEAWMDGLMPQKIQGVERCPRCPDDDAYKAEPGYVISVPGFPDVVQCTRCSYRVAYGVRMPRVCVMPVGQWVTITCEPADGSPGFEICVDKELGHLIGKNLISIT